MNREQRRARVTGPRAVDLGQLKARTAADLVRGLTEEAQVVAEVAAGLRCQGCKRRIERGYEFVRLVSVDDEAGGPPKTFAQYTHACIGHDDCDYVTRAAQDAIAMRPVQWAFLDDPTIAAMLGRAAPDAPDPTSG